MPPRRRKVAPDEPVEFNAKLRSIWEQWRYARAAIAQWDERAKRLRGQLEDAIGEAPGATVNGVQVISWKVTEKRNVFDAAAFKKDHPELHASYMVKKDGTRPFNETDFDFDQIEDDDA